MSDKALQTQDPTEHRSILRKIAERYSVDPHKMLSTLKSTAFQQKNGSISDEQMIALLIVADQYKLNPFTKEIYAFPDRQNGIVPVVGLDGWSRIINGHPEFDGMDFSQSDEMVTMEGARPAPEWMECSMYRKDRAHPVTVREYLDEVYRPPFEVTDRNGNKKTISGPWQTHTKRFLRHKTMIQCARIAFGFVGIYDQDEADRIVERDVTPASVGKPVVDMPQSRSEAHAHDDILDHEEEPVDADIQPDDA